jgi:hypothetical protein
MAVEMTVAGYTVKETMEAIRVAISAAEGVLVSYRDIPTYLIMGHIYGQFTQKAEIVDEQKDLIKLAGKHAYRIHGIGQKYVFLRIEHPIVDPQGHIQPMSTARVNRDHFILVCAFPLNEKPNQNLPPFV